jgi:hypothetical protein
MSGAPCLESWYQQHGSQSMPIVPHGPVPMSSTPHISPLVHAQLLARTVTFVEGSPAHTNSENVLEDFLLDMILSLHLCIILLETFDNINKKELMWPSERAQ